MKLKRCRLTEKQQNRLIEFFVGEMTARTAADVVGVNKTTAAYFFHRLREIIAWQLDEASPLAGEVEVDESYFGGKRTRARILDHAPRLGDPGPFRPDPDQSRRLWLAGPAPKGPPSLGAPLKDTVSRVQCLA